ncbi:putative Rad51 family DNA repair protein [Aspergillus affinis]|uniref:putative Rad51 family DNA repair protein n=1 Tax=Aspergillus affinis TaxID=1070780 RepID=UPI0022FEB96F|nr:uncharacterized protein KD926_001184 [Aspergillus affinis]KAI9036940.1 hypothetical protein KD926_001184 [Aspergillus affinis]
MAAELGEKLLGEVHEERLDELLHDLRTIYENPDDAPLRHPLGVTEIDDLLDVFMQRTPVQPAQEHPDPPLLEETGPASDNGEGEDEEYAHDQEHEPAQDDIPMNPHSWENVPAPTHVPRDTALEISSTSSGAGKSQLLYYLAATAVLPSMFAGQRLGGHESAIVFIDTDGRFEADRLRTIARGIVNDRLLQNLGPEPQSIPSAPSALSTPDLESMLSSSLQHVHVFRPESSAALLATLHNLETYLYDLPRHFSSSRPLHAIFIDSAGAFFWQDKLHDEVARTEEIGLPHADIERDRALMQSFYLADLYAELVARLKLLQRLFSCSVVYTSTAWSRRSVSSTGTGAGAGGSASTGERYGAYRPSGPFELYNPLEEMGSGPPGPAFRSPLPPPWGVFPDLRLVVQRDRVRAFPHSLTAVAAQGEQAALRREVVLQGRFLVWVNGWGREDWPRRVREGLERRNGGMFGFRVTRDGVWLT